MENIFEIHPKRPISGVLPDMKRIMDITRMPLSKAEFLRCMNSATLYAVVGDDKILVTSLDYEKALSLFDKHTEYKDKSIKDVNLEFTAQSIDDKRIDKKAKEVIDSNTPLPVEVVNKKEEKPSVIEEPEEVVKEASTENKSEEIKVESASTTKEEETVEEAVEEEVKEDDNTVIGNTEEKKTSMSQQVRQSQNNKPDIAKNFNTAKRNAKRK